MKVNQLKGLNTNVTNIELIVFKNRAHQQVTYAVIVSVL